ncbi:related to NADH2 dehydrogenase (ubiquinone) complex I 13K-A chain precursor [Cephalotrichum gorgonifer]|uniref:Related to NADH2 dehydrogenase (Ubiquinone) complex I 13K-A chain n=1 Tax=Cephalotrichum gorgonifer TaxID=2041049 RepID=A0AAE8SVG7_9PEZI|nr:related to NADH2 dehydrogenase (ubiquinone) complex I 13K-A chain precursor [Cephalotrichum gorgonifer]
MSAALRTLRGINRLPLRVPGRAFSTVPGRAEANAEPAAKVVEAEAEISTALRQQAPNRVDVWARGQKERSKAMVGPRFEQTDFTKQPRPYAAIELIHQQPVQWTHSRIVSCDGGGGPAGHPKIFINTDKPEIATCGYCGNPFANEHHRAHLESLPETSYPLK